MNKKKDCIIYNFPLLPIQLLNQLSKESIYAHTIFNKPLTTFFLKLKGKTYAMLPVSQIG